MHVDRHLLLRYPGHVLCAAYVHLGDAVRWVLIQHHSEVSSVLAAAHVLLVWTLGSQVK